MSSAANPANRADENRKQRGFRRSLASALCTMRSPGALKEVGKAGDQFFTEKETIMQVRIVAILAAVLAYAMATLVCGAQETKRDIPGWSDTQWGMGLAALKKLHPEMTIGKGRFDLTAGVIPLEIGGQQFHAYLEFKNVGGQRKKDDTSPEPPQSEWKLATVELWLETGDNKALGVCEDVANSLRGKYGDPTKSYKGGEILWWVMPSTTIIKVADEGVPGTKFKPNCSIRYFPTQISGSDKL